MHAWKGDRPASAMTLAVWLGVAALLLAACFGAETSPDSDTTVPAGVTEPTSDPGAGDEPLDRGDEPADPSTTAAPEPTAPQHPPTTAWNNDTLAGLDGGEGSSIGVVALVADDDVLNVREGPGVSNGIVGTLAPGTRVIQTGNETDVDGSTWVEIETPIGAYWVNGFFLAADGDIAPFESDRRIDALLEEFTAILAAKGDLSDVASTRGLFVAHHGDPLRFGPEELDAVLIEGTTYDWAAPDGVNPDPPQTFAEAVAESFLAVVGDPAHEELRNEWKEPPSGVPPSATPLPIELNAFNHVGLHSGGGPTDFVSWYVSVDYEDGDPRIVGLTLDSFSP